MGLCTVGLSNKVYINCISVEFIYQIACNKPSKYTLLWYTLEDTQLLGNSDNLNKIAQFTPHLLKQGSAIHYIRFTTRPPAITDVFDSGRNVGALRPGRRVYFR